MQQALRLQILIAEHWSLLATCSLSYNKSLNSIGMFLSVLTETVVALALLAQPPHPLGARRGRLGRPQRCEPALLDYSLTQGQRP
jgi:hypothetical protein